VCVCNRITSEILEAQSGVLKCGAFLQSDTVTPQGISDGTGAIETAPAVPVLNSALPGALPWEFSNLGSDPYYLKCMLYYTTSTFATGTYEITQVSHHVGMLFFVVDVLLFLLVALSSAA
jgi:hypothetical protein